MNELISIIVPVYQAERYLYKSVKTLLLQTYENIEILLIDDGSTDSSREICDKLAIEDKRVVVIHQPNKGQSAARNMGISIAKGKYIMFMDNDDFYFPDMCNTLLKNIIDHNADISSCSYLACDENNNITHNIHNYRFIIYDNAKAMEAFLLREELDIYVWTKMYRRDFLVMNEISFEEGKSDEDFLFNFQAFSYARKVVFQDIALYKYVIRSDSESRIISQTKIIKYLEDTLYRIRKIEDSVFTNYPQLLPLAKRQSILYSYIMIGAIIRNHSKFIIKYPYYKSIMNYLHRNKRQVVKEHKYWGMSYLGSILSVVLPFKAYYLYRRIRRRLFKC